MCKVTISLLFPRHVLARIANCLKYSAFGFVFILFYCTWCGVVCEKEGSTENGQSNAIAPTVYIIYEDCGEHVNWETKTKPGHFWQFRNGRMDTLIMCSKCNRSRVWIQIMTTPNKCTEDCVFRELNWLHSTRRWKHTDFSFILTQLHLIAGGKHIQTLVNC